MFGYHHDASILVIVWQVQEIARRGLCVFSFLSRDEDVPYRAVLRSCPPSYFARLGPHLSRGPLGHVVFISPALSICVDG